MHLVSPKTLHKHSFQFLLGKLYYPEEIKNKGYTIFLFGGWGGGGWTQTRWIMGDVQMANSFHLNTGDPSRNYRQRNAFQIKGFV